MNTAVKQHPHIPLTPVESSQLHAIGHDEATNTLAIQFKGKAGPADVVYLYPEYTAKDYHAFLNSKSKGKHFSAHIRNNPKHVPIKIPLQPKKP